MRCESNLASRMQAMEREQIQRDRQQEGHERTPEQAKDLSREQRSFVASNIERCESRTREREGPSTPPAGSPPGDKPKDLEQRFQKDAETLRGIEGLKLEAFKAATPEQRLMTLRDASQQLANSQERAPYRVYAVPQETLGPDIAEATLRSRESEWFRPGETRDLTSNQNTAEPRIRAILISDDLIGKRDESGKVVKESPEDARTKFFEEAFHAYEFETLEHPNKHSEVDALSRKLWQSGRETYAQDVNHDNPNKYFTNSFEAPAKVYANRMQKELDG